AGRTTAVPGGATRGGPVQMPAADGAEPSDGPVDRPIDRPVLARRVLVRAGGPRPRTPVAGVALIAAVVVALGWPLVRWVRTAPAASAQVSSPATSVPPRV